MEPNDVYKTAFALPFRQFEFVRMPFGLCNAPKTFQRAMNNLLAGYDFVRVYLDDILILGTTEENHIENIRTILNVLAAKNITINIEKCNFCYQRCNT